MPLKEAIIQGGTALGVVAGIGYVIFAKMVKSNPKMAEKLKEFMPGKLYDKIPQQEEMKDKIEQVWDEKRTMM